MGCNHEIVHKSHGQNLNLTLIEVITQKQGSVVKVRCKINNDKQPREPRLTNAESEERPGSNAHAVQRLVHTLRGRTHHHHVTKQKSEDQSRRPTTIAMVSQACRKRCGH